MTFIATSLKTILTLKYYLLTQTASRTKENQKIFMKNFSSAKIYLTLVITQKIQGFLMVLIKKLLVK